MLRETSSFKAANRSKLSFGGSLGKLIEVKSDHAAAFEACFAGLPLVKVGVTVAEPRLRIAGAGGEWLVWVKLAELKEAWQKPLRW